MVRGRSQETPCPKGGGQEELPYVQGQGQRPRVPGCNSTGMVERSYRGQEGRPRGATPRPRSRGAAERSYPESEVRGRGQEELPHAPTPEARGGGWEEQPHVKGAVAAWAQEGLEELSHIDGQEGQQ